MRVGLISDVHGNLVALDAVLAELESQGVDLTVCLGDVGTLGARPARVIDRLREADCVCVMGNHDAYLLDESSLSANSTIPGWMREQIHWCADRLSAEALDFLRSFESEVEVSLGSSHNLLCVHGSPRSYEEMILSTTPPGELEVMLEGLRPGILATGHSHLQMVRRHKGILIVNPGSVGEPLQEMPFAEPKILPWAEYAVVQVEHGTLSIDLRRIPVDVGEVLKQFELCDMPNANHWVELWRTAEIAKPKSPSR